MPLISVIIPIYNTERLLPKCIESVLAQTLSDIEIILIDDGSTDESGKICDSYACKDKRIHVTHILNHGVSHARNKGIELSQGKYIHFMDSDDRSPKCYRDSIVSSSDIMQICLHVVT